MLKSAGALSARGQINVDERTNTVIIRDLPSYVEKAKGLMAELDTATPQVEIEARIVVTNRNFSRDFGIQWGFGGEQTARFGNTTGRVFPNQIVVNGGGVPGAGGPPGRQPGPGRPVVGDRHRRSRPAATRSTCRRPTSTPRIGISMGNVLGSFNLDVALTALEQQGRGRLLSTPKVTTQNNQAAEIKQGVQIPIQTVANNTVTTQFKDAVLTLKVTPQITDAGTVILTLEVENSTPDFGNPVNGIPPINTQAAKTIVLVKDGQTAVVGGIYQSQEFVNEDKTPVLGNIPLLGYLFRRKGTQNAEQRAAALHHAAHRQVLKVTRAMWLLKAGRDTRRSTATLGAAFAVTAALAISGCSAAYVEDSAASVLLQIMSINEGAQLDSDVRRRVQQLRLRERGRRRGDGGEQEPERPDGALVGRAARQLRDPLHAQRRPRHRGSRRALPDHRQRSR